MVRSGGLGGRRDWSARSRDPSSAEAANAGVSLAPADLARAAAPGLLDRVPLALGCCRSRARAARQIHGKFCHPLSLS